MTAKASNRKGREGDCAAMGRDGGCLVSSFPSCLRKVMREPEPWRWWFEPGDVEKRSLVEPFPCFGVAAPVDCIKVSDPRADNL